MNWTQPRCERCWFDDPENENIRIPVRVITDDPYEWRICAWCGKPTVAGIFVRVDPRTVPYPEEEDA